MEIPSKYNPAATEDKWYGYWLEKKYFHSEPDEREPYTVVIPPPNVTGVLHMGHMLNNTLQDVLVRRARMQGKNACWVPGTDHASIATEAKVVNKLKQEGIDKDDLSRDEFLAHAWEWKEKHGGIILEQLKKLGASCDWDRTRFTMDEALYESVIDVFIDLYEKGLIYRGVRMVNWDPQAQTAVSDEEVIHKEVQSKLYYLRYRVEGEDDFLTIATTRPETILGDTAVCVHPEDERFKKYVGKKVIVPLVNRPVPVIADEYVDREFGTGALKITPAHDVHDYEIGQKHHLESIDIFNDDGTMNEAAQLYVGKDRFAVRKEIVKDLEAAGSLVKVEDYVNSVGFSERTDAVIEPKLSMQWFLKMKELARPALEVVEKDEIKFHPAKFKNTYRHWMENVRDWNISRQLWWGQRIPVYYLPDGRFVVAKSVEEALEKARKQFDLPDLKPADLKQDEDVMDTWFSSWLWPISVFDGIRFPDNEEIRYYYPTNDLVTGPDIIFFWVARMIMAGLEYRKEIPFRNVYFTGIVRDKLGRKMSKTLGNSPDPLELIKKYGADGVRVGMLLTAPAGNDLPFDEALCEQGRNFSNKIWNALRLVKGWKADAALETPEHNKLAIAWFEDKLNETLAVIEKNFATYRISDALMATYKLIWDSFCSWYLEMVKPAYQQPIDGYTLEKTLAFFEALMKMLHPFMPFITEEIWHLLRDRQEGDDIIVASMPQSQPFDAENLKAFERAGQIILGIRNLRKEKNIPNKEKLELKVKAGETARCKFYPVVIKLGNLSGVETVDEKPDGVLVFTVGAQEFYVPLAESVDVEAEIKKIEEELNYTRGFLNSVMKKLSNERFVNNAPAAVVEKERKKQADAEARIKVLEEQLKGLR
ncbi:valine--tRNA ligase [Candidatus Sulfidibacterium hydrothermale]|uniref:valine--tRNA ligase n=1 Tax=Candidatus Sulfidibacterium hydrothermale TaxID=2875962 RepID=UPI001F0ADCE7|nr:valine--tRNA ligase [Candidatus Sulfidibacterium hydrothermale]